MAGSLVAERAALACGKMHIHVDAKTSGQLFRAGP